MRNLDSKREEIFENLTDGLCKAWLHIPGKLLSFLCYMSIHTHAFFPPVFLS